MKVLLKLDSPPLHVPVAVADDDRVKEWILLIHHDTILKSLTIVPCQDDNDYDHDDDDDKVKKEATQPNEQDSSKQDATLPELRLDEMPPLKQDEYDVLLPCTHSHPGFDLDETLRFRGYKKMNDGSTSYAESRQVFRNPGDTVLMFDGLRVESADVLFQMDQASFYAAAEERGFHHLRIRDCNYLQPFDEQCRDLEEEIKHKKHQQKEVQKYLEKVEQMNRKFKQPPLYLDLDLDSQCEQLQSFLDTNENQWTQLRDELETLKVKEATRLEERAQELRAISLDDDDDEETEDETDESHTSTSTSGSTTTSSPSGTCKNP